MAFEVYVPRGSGFGPPLPSGTARLGRAGTLALNAVDLVEMNMGGECLALLVDPSSRRLALRAPRDGEPSVRVPNKTKKGRPRTRRVVNVRGALKQMGLEVRALAGDYELLTRDDLLIVHFAAAPADRRGKRRGGSG